MTAKESLYAIVSPIFSGKFYQSIHPDADGAVTEDYAVYSQVGGAINNHLQGQSSLRRPRFQISVFSLDGDRRDELVGFVEAAMSLANDAANAAIDLAQDPYNTVGALLNQQVGMAIDGYEHDTKRHYAHLDFYCWEQV